MYLPLLLNHWLCDRHLQSDRALPSIILLSVVFFITGCQRESTTIPVLSGFVTSQNLYLSASASAKIQHIYVRQGDRIATGQKIFDLDLKEMNATIAGIEAQIAQASASLAVEQALTLGLRSARARSERELERLTQLHDSLSGAVAQSELDQSRDLFNQAQANLSASLARVKSLYAQARYYEAQLTKLRAQRDNMQVTSPATGIVQSLSYQEGEWAPTNSVIVSIIPDSQRKIRFYIPEAELQRYAIGSRIIASCSGCVHEIMADIDFIAVSPEYNPPVMYSLDARSRMVFLAEASVREARDALVIGQPLTLHLNTR